MTDLPQGASRQRRLGWIAALALVAIVAGAVAANWLRVAPSATDAGPLLAISLPDPRGAEQALAQWRGKLLVVNFWATWCAPCREEMPMFMKAQAEHGARGLQFVGIAVDEAAKVERYVQEVGLNYPTLVGGFGAMELSRTLGNRVMALPFTVVVNREGRVALTQLGPFSQSQLDRILKEML